MYAIRSFTLPELVEQGAHHYEERPALSMVGGKPVSYRELEARTRQVAALLSLYGLKAGDRIGLVAENSPQWGIAYLGASRTGAVLVPILTDFTAEQMGNILDHAEAKLVFVSRRCLPKLEHSRGKRILVAVEDLSLIDGPAGAFNAAGDPARLESALQSLVLPKVRGEDLAAIVYTSGTTGLSKGVMLSHKNIVWNAWACRSIIVLRRTDRALSVLPLAHTYEFTIGFVIPIMQGSSIYYLDRPPSASALLPALASIRPTIMLTVPLIIEKIYRANVRPGLEAIGLYKVAFLRPLLERLAGIKLMKTFGGKVRFFGIGGAPLAEDVEAFLRRAKFPYAIGYGLTETSPLLAGANPRKQAYRSTGPVLKGLELRIREPNPETGVGELEGRGPSVFSGYYKDPERTREVLSDDGWFRTGDLGSVDAQGRVYVRGRSKTMILGASGENIYPEEIEAVINRSPYVQESLVYGDESGLTALIHLKPEVLEELGARVKDGIESAEMAAASVGQAMSDAAEAAGKAAGDAFTSLEHSASQLLDRIKKEANSKLAAFSRIKTVELQKEPFEKTPKQSIKRFLYPRSQKP